MADQSPTDFLRSGVPLAATLGIEADEISPGRVVLRLGHDETLCTSGGAMHGGTLMALADTAGGVCAFLNLPDGAAGTSTIESKTNFLGAAREGTVTAVATPLHVGRTTVVVETELRCGDRLVAKTTQTQAVLTR
jgi:1,4-dihydroxy-2-naphthoyl-CoA hydrolase